MLKQLFALAAVAVCTLAAPESLPVEEYVGVKISQHINEIEVAVTDDTLDMEGLAVSASVDVKVEVVNGVAMINDKFLLPIGLTQIQIKEDVKKYVLSMGSTHKRRYHKTIPDVDVGIAARVVRDVNNPNTMHITLQLTEYDGVTKEIEHTTHVAVTVNENNEELLRTVYPKSKPLSLEERLEAAQHKVSSLADQAESGVENGIHTACDWFMDKWNGADDYGKASIVAVLSLGLVMVVLAFVCCLRACCSTRTPAKGSNYKKNLGGVRLHLAGDKFKNVKYQPLHGEP